MSATAPSERRSGNLGGHRARKRFGQHFLTDQHVLSALLEQINPQPADNLIEIGPGLGALTGLLLARLQRLTAIELDRDLAARLRDQYPDPTLELIEGDALQVDWRQLTQAGQFRLVGNLPYNISTPLLVTLIGCCNQVLDQHFMLQREVVRRVVATKGSDYGRLGILLQAFYRCDSVLDVPATAFTPAPKVESAVVRMRRLPEPLVPNASDLQSILAVAFGQRRKMLRGTLLPWLDKKAVSHDELDPTARAENVCSGTYYLLAQRLTQTRAAGWAIGPNETTPDVTSQERDC